MKETKFKKLVKEYPYLLDRNFKLSRAQAEAMWRQAGGFPSLERIVKLSKSRSCLPADAWSVVDGIIEKEKQRKTHAEQWAIVCKYFRRHKAMVIITI